jgi:phage terminase large subunit-like protein
VLNPVYQNRFKTKHLNVWCSASVAGINMQHWKLAADPGLSVEEFAGQECLEILDLASKSDICCEAKLFTKSIGGKRHYYAFVRHYLPEQSIEEADHNAQAYDKWMKSGALIATPGAEVDFDLLREQVELDKNKFQILEIVYDPWRATQLAHQLQKTGATVVEIGQTANNMAEAFDELITALKAGRFHHTGDPVLEWMASNVIARQVKKGMFMPGKDKPQNKIDGIVAIVMGISRALAVEPSGSFEDALLNMVTA